MKLKDKVAIITGAGRGLGRAIALTMIEERAAVSLISRSSEELKPVNIQVNAIDPGVMDTTMQEKVRASGLAILGDPVYDRFMYYKEKIF